MVDGGRWRGSVEVAAGEVLLVASANGSGKTTLLRLIAGLCRPSRGTVEIGGLGAGSDRRARHRWVSMLGHDTGLYSGLTALETLRLWARLLGRACGVQDLEPHLIEVGLETRRDHLVAGFSAGMKKRLALARLRLEDPQLILLDEPFAAFDPAGQALVERWIAAYRATGRTVIMASHAVERSARICDRALLLHQGQMAWQGPATELSEHLATWGCAA